MILVKESRRMRMTNFHHFKHNSIHWIECKLFVIIRKKVRLELQTQLQKLLYLLIKFIVIIGKVLKIL